MSWHLSRYFAFDLESTDKDPETALIVSAAVIGCGGGKPTDTHTWLAAVEVPEEASKINGITTEYAMANGRPAIEVIGEVATAVAGAVDAHLPIVGHNVAYDLTLLDRELRRNGLATIDERTGGAPLLALDTMVLDKHALPFRKSPPDDRTDEEKAQGKKRQGPYQLKTCAQVHLAGSHPWDVEAAHSAGYDALMSARVAYRLGCLAHMPRAMRPDYIKQLRYGDRLDDLAVDLVELHQRQIRWAAQHASELQEYFRSPKAGDKQDPDAVVDGSWPLRPYVEAAVAS